MPLLQVKFIVNDHTNVTNVRGTILSRITKFSIDYREMVQKNKINKMRTLYTRISILIDDELEMKGIMYTLFCMLC